MCRMMQIRKELVFVDRIQQEKHGKFSFITTTELTSRFTNFITESKDS